MSAEALLIKCRWSTPAFEQVILKIHVFCNCLLMKFVHYILTCVNVVVRSQCHCVRNCMIFETLMFLHLAVNCKQLIMPALNFYYH